jgi:monoamine oxidase
MVPSRRDILVAGGAAALSTLWGCGSTSNSMSPGAPPTESPSNAPQATYDVIVVGSGSAGIAAARAVQTAKRSVLVLEAQDHLGGRCFSDTTTFPIPFDPGAQFVGQSQSLNNFLYPLIRQLGIALIPGEDIPRAFFNPATGKEADASEFFLTYGGVDAAILSAGLAMTLGAPDASVLDVVTAAGLQHSPYVNMAYQFLVSALTGGSPAVQSTLDLYGESQFVPAAFAFPLKDSFVIPSGYGAFIARLAKGLSIRYSTPVASIDYSGTFVKVKTTTGKTFTAKAAIVTTSVNVLKSGSITFAPELPPNHASALSGMSMGHAWKAMLEFRGKPFDGPLGAKPGKMSTAVGLVNADSPQFFVNYCAQQFPKLENTYVVAIAENAPGIRLERMGPQKAGKEVCALLETPFPGVTAAWTGRIVASNWLTNPYTRGCLTYATTGNAGARTRFAQPVDKKVWFAGEGVSVHSHGTVNGAWATGTDAAYGALFALGALAKHR